jgi:hypothetical protein
MLICLAYFFPVLYEDEDLSYRAYQIYLSELFTVKHHNYERLD